MKLSSSDSVQFVIFPNCLHTVQCSLGMVPMYQVLGKHLPKNLPNTWVNTLQYVNSQQWTYRFSPSVPHCPGHRHLQVDHFFSLFSLPSGRGLTLVVCSALFLTTEWSSWYANISQIAVTPDSKLLFCSLPSFQVVWCVHSFSDWPWDQTHVGLWACGPGPDHLPGEGPGPRGPVWNHQGRTSGTLGF